MFFFRKLFWFRNFLVLASQPKCTGHDYDLGVKTFFTFYHLLLYLQFTHSLSVNQLPVVARIKNLLTTKHFDKSISFEQKKNRKKSLQYSCANWYDLFRKKTYQLGRIFGFSSVFSRIFFGNLTKNRKTYQLAE